MIENNTHVLYNAHCQIRPIGVAVKNSSDDMYDQIQALKRYAKNLPWYAKWIFPQQLVTLLAKPDVSPAQICWAFLDNVYWFHRLFFVVIRSFSQLIPDYLKKSLSDLHHANLLVGEIGQSISDVVMKHKAPDQVANAIIMLNNYGLATKENIELVANLTDMNKVIACFSSEKCVDLMRTNDRQANFMSLVECAHPSRMLNILWILNRASLLSTESGSANHAMLKSLAEEVWRLEEALELLENKGLLNQENFESVVYPGWHKRRASSLVLMEQIGLLRGEFAEANRKAILQNDSYEYYSESLLQLAINMGFMVEEKAQATFEAIVKNNRPEDLVSLLEIISNLGFLSGANAQENFNAIVKHQRPYDLIENFQLLISLKMLDGEHDQAIFNALITNEHPYYFAEVIIKLNQFNLLSGGACHTIVIAAASSITYREYFFDAFTQANADILFSGEEAQANCLVVLKHKHSPSLAGILVRLQHLNLLNAANRLLVADYSHTPYLEKAIDEVITADFFAEHAQVILTALVSQPYLDSFSIIAKLITGAGLFNLVNTLALLRHPDLVSVKRILQRLHNDTQVNLSQENFDRVLRFASLELMTQLDNQTPNEITQERFTQMMTVIQNSRDRHEDEAVALREYVRRIRRAPQFFALAPLVVQPVRARVFNTAQSTHTASVHVTTDLSAWLLWAKYGEDHSMVTPSLQNIIEALDQLSPSLDISIEELTAAKICLERLLGVFVDISLTEEKKSKSLRLILETELKDDIEIQPLLPILIADMGTDRLIPLNRFIAWLFKEIEQPTSANYLIAFTKALYEIQRGGNLDETGVDNGLANSPICYGGSANKFCERLQGFSGLIKFLFVNDQTIALKIKQLTFNSLLEQANMLCTEAIEGSDIEKAAFCQFIDDLMDDDKVSDRFVEKFDDTALYIQLIDEFKAYTICEGTRALKVQITLFKDSCLPYLPAIQLINVGGNNFYSRDFLIQFERLVAAKMQLTEVSIAHPGLVSVTQTLSETDGIGGPTL